MQDETIPDKKRQSQDNRDKTRQHTHKTRPDKTRQNKIRQDETR